jgi:hypothetical protein
MVGVLTNFKDWIFTWYSVENEIKNKKNRAERKPLLVEFEYSETITIFDFKSKTKDIKFRDNYVQLGRVLFLLEHLLVYFAN